MVCFELCFITGTLKENGVSILVLMDGVLRGIHSYRLIITIFNVSILVLMDGVLRDGMGFPLSVEHLRFQSLF